MLDPSSFTLSRNGSRSPPPVAGPGVDAGVVTTRSSGAAAGVQDDRWTFKDESLLPKPRPFEGGERKYRAGRGSSVPLDLSVY